MFDNRGNIVVARGFCGDARNNNYKFAWRLNRHGRGSSQRRLCLTPSLNCKHACLADTSTAVCVCASKTLITDEWIWLVVSFYMQVRMVYLMRPEELQRSYPVLHHRLMRLHFMKRQQKFQLQQELQLRQQQVRPVTPGVERDLGMPVFAL